MCPLCVSQVVGLWLLLVALAIVTHQARFKKIVMETLNNPAVMTLSGLVALGLGLIIVVSNNIWVAAWPVLVTLVGWVFIFQGIMRLFWPEAFAKMMKDMLAGSGYKVMAWVWLIVGAYLTYVTFFVVSS